MSVTLKDFIEYRSKMCEFRKLVLRIEMIQEGDPQFASDVVKGSSDEFPYLERSFKIVGISEYSKSLSDKKKRAAELELELKERKAALCEFLEGIEDAEIKDTLTLYYLDCVKYAEVARMLGYAGDGSAQLLKARDYVKGVKSKI